ncbi:MAG TPA: amino acid adenylation domain-containing protein, partial [Thermoanaerobaculia bacterium]|nr:amino acid adenylation domain-containing protein [Thermoanaerobaculia bacterium]
MIVAEGFRLSPQQGRLWELQKDGEQPYRSVCTVRLEGPLAPQRFQAAVERVVARHEILRTTFRIPPAMALPLQVIEEGGGIAFRHYDLRGLDSVTKEARLAGLMSDMDRLAFDLAGGPLLHVTVASLSLSEHRLLIALPTLCADVASLRNLVRELGEAHQGLDQEDPVQYADIAEALNELLESEETAAGREYWRQLRMPEARAKLPFESASVAGRGPWPARIVSGVEPDLWASVKLLARQSKCSLPTVLLSAWAALLVRLTGETEQTIAVGYDGRTYEGLDKACGLFARDLPVRCEFQADLPFAAALVTVELEKSVAGRWQDSFSWGLLAASERAAKAVDLPFAFDFEDAATSFAIGDLMFHVDRLTGVASRPKLRLVCRVQDDEVAIELDYDGSVLRAVDVRLAAERFLILLRDAVDHPEKPVGELRFLAVGERHQIVLELNDTERNHLGEECLHRLVEGQCDRTPCLTAVAFADRTLTYAELDADANQLARKLIRMGVGPNGIVAICMERSLEMVVSLLGVLKAGGAYLPLDPSYPAERLSSILADAMPSLVLGQERLRHALPHDRVPFIAVDMEAEANREEFSLRPTTSVDGDDLAYVIYTSGSTGHPKGVMVSHRAIRNRLLWMRDNHPLAAGDRVLQKTPHSFDASIWEFFLPLVCGARLVMAQPDGHQDSSYLVRAVIEHEITVLQLVPSMLRVVVEERELAACACLRRVFCGGEALTGDLIDKLSARIDAELHNLYGPTEAAIDVAHWICHPEDRKGIVPIGRPLDNVRIHLLDGRLEPAPFGVAGELYIGGVNLARGYLGRPDLTAERFVPDRFGLQSGGRLYRTGDLVRRRPDGTLDFLGRIDHQVKVRGFRIELGEIEAILRRHSAVSNAVVTLREDSPGKPRLVAYYVTSADAEVSAAELRDLAQRVLPAYMVPGVFVRLRALPVLPNGKLNHRALPPPDENLLGAGADSGDFQSLTEQVLVTIWSDLLAIDRVGIHDNFFALGGHSLAATQMAARLRSVFGAEVSLRTFFDRPTIAELAGVIEQARLAGRGLLSPPIVPAGRNRDLPLSFAQQRLWFLDQLQPGNPAYNIRLANRLVGKLSPGVLRQTLQEIVRRHESLRTTIQGVGGQPIQAIAPDLEVLLPVVDLRGIPEAKRDALTHELAAEESRRTFDLSQGPLIRATLLQTLGEEHLALITMHHVIGDGWSTGVLVREVAEIYLAFSHGLPSPLPELPIQYADFACWQREWLTGEILEAQLAFWRERLADLPVLQLPTDHPRPTIQSVRGAAHPLRLDRELTEGLKALGRRQGASLFMTLLAGFSALLSRHTGSRDLAVGCPVANRTRAEVENLIGFFANTLVLRTDLSGDPPFRALLKRASEGVLEASVYQDLPFERLVDALQVERDLSQNPLFQVMLVVQNAPKRVIEIAGLTMSSLLLQTGTAKFDLTLDFTETSAGLYGVLEYNADLFEPATLERMAGHLVTLLQGAAAEPDLLLSELPLLTGAEANQMLVLWNDTGTAYPDGLLHTLIEAQVARSPRAVALEFAGECLSYEALDRQANQLAHALLARGVQADQPVAVLAERSVEMVVALLAILKAGGAYMPLDPDYPRERLAFMLNDARPRVLLTQDRLMELVPEQAAQVFCLTPEGRELAGFPDHPPAVPLSPDNLSYVIYTSGSTGIPKGAMVHHRGIVNRLLWMQAAYGLTEEDCVLQKTPFTFDVSVWEFFWPLLAGARLVVALPGGHRDSSYLARLIAERGVTTLHFVPSMLQVFLDEPRIADCRSLRRVFCSGEALSRELQDRFFFRLDTELHNLYGPTEASVDVSFWVCRPAADRWAVPIGRPIANLRLYIVDSDTRPVPVGVAGELLIGGMGLGRGYLGRPGLTAERFIPAALGGTPGERLYRTGDLARFLPDGNVEFLGRIDYQVKIRGLRVELGEVEVALERDPAVRQAVAVVAEFAPGDRRLIAYVVAAEGGSPEAGELRRFVGESLPEYMVPTFIVPLQSLPLLSNGKVDRRALPLPAPARAEVTSSPALPTPTEEILAGFWEKILGVERVGREDDFFRLGGHSLLATQVISRIRDTFEVELPLRAIFEKPTIAALATEVERQQGAGPSLSLPPLRRLPGDGDLPLSFAQERVWLIEQLVPGNPVYNISSGLRLSGALNVPALALALSEIAGRHEALRATFHSVEGRPVQRTTPPAPLPLNVVDLSGLDAVLRDAVEHQLVAGEARRPFDLDRGPLLRASLLQLQPGEHLVHFTIHHLVADAWSLNVFSRELSTLYAAFDSGSPHGLPALPLQYADFAHWQRQWLTGDLLATELAHWEVQLAGMPPLDLPTDFPRPAVQSFRGGRRVIELPASLLQPLRRLGADSGVTGFMLLLGAFETLLQRYSGQDDAGIGFPMTNRRRTELEPLIGFFVNTLVIRMDLSKDPSFRELLARIRKAALAAYAHQELPFELLVSRLQPERDLSRNPLAQVAFQLLYGESRPVELPGLSLSRPPQAGAIARFDLELVATEVGDRLLVNVDYATDLFEHSTAERLLRHFRNLLMAAVQDPARRLSVLPMLDAAEAAQLLAVWNHQVTWEPTQSLCGLFEEHAARQPQAAAVIFETDDLSYGDLNRRANRLAHHLRELGVRAGDLVGLCTDRSLDMVVGVLGILKAGGAYLPLDPTYPRERLTYMMDDAGIPILLAQRRFRDGLARPGTTFVEVDDPGSWSGVEENPRPSATAGSVAYVIYTSGSTGRPKGVMVTHGQVVRLFSATREWFGFDAQDTWTLFHSYAFDFSVWELWGALLHGGRLVVVPYWVSRSPEALHKLLSGEGVTVLNQTPSAFQELVRSEEDLGRVD